MERRLIIKKATDGHRILSTDGVEYWDVDGPFETEAEAEARRAELATWPCECDD